MEALPEPRDFEKVPGHWRCIRCGTRLLGEERPECACGDGRVVALSWKIYGNEGYRRAAEAEALAESRLAKAKEQAERVVSDLRGQAERQKHLLVAFGVAAGAELLALAWLLLR